MNAESPLSELGRRLREARSKRGWSLQQISERTRITVKHLQALEQGNVSGMPAPVYIRGFVRGYAKALDLSEEEMLRSLDEAGILPATVPIVTDLAAEPASWRPHSRTLGLTGAVLAGGIALGFGIRGFVRFMGSTGDSAVPASPFAAAPAAPKPRATADDGLATAGAMIAAPAGARLPDTVVVSVTAIQECWVEAQTDARRAHNEILKRGETRSWQGEAKVRLMIGNPAGLEVSGPFGAVPLPRKAPRGIHLLFTRRGVQPLEIPPASATGSSDSVPPR